MSIDDHNPPLQYQQNQKLLEELTIMMSDNEPFKSYVIYTRNDCPFCKLAIDLLEQKNKPYIKENIPLDQKDVWKETISKQFGQEITTFPVIFLNVNEQLTYIGGYDDLEHHLHKERLDLIKKKI